MGRNFFNYDKRLKTYYLIGLSKAIYINNTWDLTPLIVKWNKTISTFVSNEF